MVKCDYDTIVIGSGIGGMTVSLTLSQAGQKVLLLEQHTIPGGWCQSFDFHGHLFCPGIHYIGELGQGERVKKIFEQMGLDDKLSFLELNPKGYDHAVCPNDRFDFPKGKEALMDKLKLLFPKEAKGIEKYLTTCLKINEEWERMVYFSNGIKDLLVTPFKAPTITRFALSTFKQLLHLYIKDPRLIWILSTQCLDSGLAPGKLSGVLGAMVQTHFMNGGYYPKGGVNKIVNAFLNSFKEAGGSIRTQAQVKEILIETSRIRPKATGVRLEDGTVIFAKNIVSNADAGITFQKLIDKKYLSSFLKRRLNKTVFSCSCSSIYLVFDTPPDKLGLDSGNIFYSQSQDMEEIYARTMSPHIMEEKQFPLFFLSIDSAKDPDRFKDKKEYTAMGFGFMSYTPFRQYEGSQHQKRPADYIVLKEKGHSNDVE